MDTTQLSGFPNIDDFLMKIGVGRRSINDQFFNESHKVCKVFQKTGITVEDDEDLCHDVMKEFPCNVVGCKAMFHNLIDFEIHYNGSHRYVCQECKKIRANARLLEIHIQETHDSYFQVLAERQPMYQCYVSECNTKFANPSERQEHCTSVHKFPKHFRYDCDKKNKGKLECVDAMEVEPQNHKSVSKLKNTKIILNKNQKSKTFVPSGIDKSPAIPNFSEESQMECLVNKSDDVPKSEIHKVATEKSNSVAKSALAFVPRQVANKSYTNALTNNKSKQRNVLETETLMELAKSLPE